MAACAACWLWPDVFNASSLHSAPATASTAGACLRFCRAPPLALLRELPIAAGALLDTSGEGTASAAGPGELPLAALERAPLAALGLACSSGGRRPCWLAKSAAMGGHAMGVSGRAVAAWSFACSSGQRHSCWLARSAAKGSYAPVMSGRAVAAPSLPAALEGRHSCWLTCSEATR